jgi:tRNA(adenine34) deaminase
MDLAINEAQKALEKGEVPIGAIIVLENKVIAAAYNNRESANNPVGHAELLAIEKASQELKRWRLTGCTLYVTLEPCVMCAGAIVLSRLDRVVFGTVDPKAGAVKSLYQILEDSRLNHRPEVVGGVRKDVCSKLLKDFFVQKRTGI